MVVKFWGLSQLQLHLPRSTEKGKCFSKLEHFARVKCQIKAQNHIQACMLEIIQSQFNSLMAII